MLTRLCNLEPLNPTFKQKTGIYRSIRFFSYRIRSSYRTMRLGFSKLPTNARLNFYPIRAHLKCKKVINCSKLDDDDDDSTVSSMLLGPET